MDPGWFRAGTRKERLEKNRPVLLQNVAPTPLGNTRALEGPFFDPGSEGQSLELGKAV